jgi:hypothetical protein
VEGPHRSCRNVRWPGSRISRLETAGIIGSDQAAQAHSDLVDLSVELGPYEPLAARVWELQRNLTCYDGAGIVATSLQINEFLSYLDAMIRA